MNAAKPYRDEDCLKTIESIKDAIKDFQETKGFRPKYILMSPVLRWKLGVIMHQIGMIDLSNESQTNGSEITRIDGLTVISRDIKQHYGIEFGW